MNEQTVYGHGTNWRMGPKIDIRGILMTCDEKQRSDLEAIVENGEEDSNLRREARKLLNAESHRQRERWRADVKDFRSRLRRARKRKADREAQKQAEKRRVDDNWTLDRVSSRRNLRRIGGKRLELCVGGRKYARHYWRKVRRGETELWFALKDGKTRGLIECDRRTRKITECSGRRKEELDLAPGVAFGILAALDATADDEGAFGGVGAFGVFRNGAPEVETIGAGDRAFRIWNYPSERIVAASKADGRWEWSRFTVEKCPFTERDEWSECYYSGMTLGELFDVMTRCPKVAEKLLSSPIGAGT